MEGSTEFSPGEAKQGSLASLVGRLSVAIHRQISPGDVAELRRLVPDDPGGAAFWRLMASTVVGEGRLPEGGPSRDGAERRWAAVLSAMAITKDLHQPRRSMGAALGAAGYSELRFVRLLRARGDALLNELRGAARYLASRAESVDPVEFARLVFSDGADWEESARRRIAREFYAISEG